MPIKHYHDYCESEYNLAKNCIANNPYNLYSLKEIRDNALQRLLGAGYLAQHIGASFEEVEREFYLFKEKIEKICETP